MCLAVPVRIVELDGEEATVEIQGVRRLCNISLLPDVKVGDPVLIHAGFAIQKWSEEDVDEFNGIIKEINETGAENDD